MWSDAPDIKITRIKAEFFAGLTNACAFDHPEYQHLCVQIVRADSIASLWYLRCDVYRVVSMTCGEKNALVILENISKCFR